MSPTIVGGGEGPAAPPALLQGEQVSRVGREQGEGGEEGGHQQPDPLHHLLPQNSHWLRTRGGFNRREIAPSEKRSLRTGQLGCVCSRAVEVGTLGRLGGLVLGQPEAAGTQPAKAPRRDLQAFSKAKTSLPGLL